MESKKYRRFLEQQAEKNPMKPDSLLGDRPFKVSWESNPKKAVLKKTSDILDSLYLGKEMPETVTMDRRVAGLLQDRLKGLEEENIRMRKRIKIMTLLAGVLVISVVVVSIALILVYFPAVHIVI